MRTLNRFIPLFLFAMLALPAAASGTAASANLAESTSAMTDVRLEGSVAYEVSGGTVTFTIDKITNYSSSSTGTLYLTLWATESSSASGSGYNLGSVSIGSLSGNAYYYDIVQNASYTAPPDGTYYLHVLLGESSPTSFVDSMSFGQETFGGGSGGGDTGGGDTGGGSGSGSGDLSMRGTVLPVYDTDGFIEEIVFYGVDESYGTVSIENTGSSTSGALKIRMVASDEPYSGGTLSGHVMTDYDLNALSAGSFYADFTAYVSPSSTHPEYGEYYVYVLLMERASDNEYYIVDWDGSSQTKITVGCGPTSSCTGSGGSGGGGGSGGDSSGDDGGGGALHPLFLLLAPGLFAALVRGRRRYRFA